MPTPALPDFVLVVLILVGYPLWDYYIAWPRARARLASGDPDARRALYRAAMLTQWSATAVVVAIWLWYRRDASLLWLQAPAGSRLIVAAFLSAGVITLMAAQVITATRAGDATRNELRPLLGYAIAILPRTVAERSWFMALSITAGICEELIYRGYVVWALAPRLGLWGAGSVSVAGFGIAHAYLGKQGVVRATIAGVVFAGAVIGLRSLYPGMVLHAALDLGAGFVGYALLRDATIA